MKVERSIDIAAPPEDVYDVVMDPRRLADWVTVHAGLDDGAPQKLREGSRLGQSLKLAGQKFHVEWTVVTARPPRSVEWEGRGPLGAKARVAYELEDRGEDCTCFNYANEYDLPGGPLGKLGGRAFARKAGREADRTLEKLKGLLENSR